MNKAIQPVIILILLGLVAYLAFGDKMFNNDEQPKEETEISEEIEPETEKEQKEDARPEAASEVKEEKQEEVAVSDYPVFDNCKSVEQYALNENFKKLEIAPTLYKHHDSWMIYGDYYLHEICYAANKNTYLMSGSRNLALGDSRLKIFQFNADNKQLLESNEFKYTEGKVSFGARNGKNIPVTINRSYVDFSNPDNMKNITNTTKLTYDLTKLTLIKQ